MPEKDGSEDKKSTKSVVNRKQKQFMNQEEQLDLSSVAESFGGKIVGEPVELDEIAPAIPLAYYAIPAIATVGAGIYDRYRKNQGKSGIFPDMSGVVKGVYDKIRGVHRSKKINPEVDKSFGDTLRKIEERSRKNLALKMALNLERIIIVKIQIILKIKKIIIKVIKIIIINLIRKMLR